MLVEDATLVLKDGPSLLQSFLIKTKQNIILKNDEKLRKKNIMHSILAVSVLKIQIMHQTLTVV